LLTADPGVGKTRLAGELLRRHVDGATVLESRAHSMSGGVAFGMWAEALDPLLQVLSDDDVAQLCGGFLDDLSALFHRVAAMRGPWSTAPAGHEPPRPRLLAGLIRMLDELCGRGPLVILLDDMHWADASSWEVLRQIARRLDSAPLLLLLTARPVELAEHSGAAPVLFDLEQDGLLTRLELTPLQNDGLRALAEQIIGAEPKTALVDWVAERSRGNVLFAIGLLRALLEEDADLSAPVLTRLPESLTERVAARAKLLPPHHVAVLEHVAVAGRPVALPDLIALTDSTLEDIGPVLAEMVAARTIVETERGRSLTYELPHPLVRDVAYEQIGGARRRVLHRRAARVLREGGHIAEAAAHYASSAEPGDPEAVSALLEALREAEQREAVSEALTMLGALVELLPANDRRWLDVLDAMHGQATWITDHRADSRFEVAVAALRAIDGQLTEADDPSRRALVKFRLANFLAWGVGDGDVAFELHVAARDLFEAAGDLPRMRLAEFELAWNKGLHGDFAAMTEAARGLAVSAEEAGDRPAAMLAWTALATSAFFGGHIAEAEAANKRAGELAEAAGATFRSSMTESRSAMWLAVQGRITDARRALAESRQANHAGYRESGGLSLEANTEWVAGNFRAALEAARESDRVSAGTRERLMRATVCGAFAAVEVGEPAEARRHLDRADAMLGGRHWHGITLLTRYAEGLLLWSTGEPASAVGVLREGAARLHRMDLIVLSGLALPDLAELAHTLDDPDLAIAAAKEATEIAGRMDQLTYTALADLAAAWAALAGEDCTAAIAAARSAIEHVDATEWRAHQAKARHVLGCALLTTAPAEAVAALEDAARRYADCGALWRRGLVLDLLRQQGAPARRALAATVGPAPLTRRERDVAMLAAQGLAVKEIAAQLFVGERTVETHLGNVYAKLGVDSKLDLVRRAAELGLA
jgi:DNA-binding NarL/FixJ family response regulator